MAGGQLPEEIQTLADGWSQHPFEFQPARSPFITYPECYLVRSVDLCSTSGDKDLDSRLIHIPAGRRIRSGRAGHVGEPYSDGLVPDPLLDR